MRWLSGCSCLISRGINRDPLCQEASRIVSSGACSNVWDQMYVCDSVFERLSRTYYAPPCEDYPASPDMFKVRVIPLVISPCACLVRAA